MDRPNARSSHIEPTLRGGGVAIVSVVVIIAGIIASAEESSAVLILLVATASLAGISFWDDWRGVPVVWRFACHSFLAILAIGAFEWPGLKITLEGNSAWVLPYWASILILFLWVVGHTNAFNFMDGINGIAGAQTFIVALGSGSLVGLVSGKWNDSPVMISFIVGGAAGGFLPHNFPRARMFMGDVGSAPLGFILACLTLWMAKSYGWWLLIPLVLLSANFVLDTGITLIRRVFNGERWYSAHREHFYQRLVRSGKSHTFVTLLEMALQLVVLSLMILYLYVGVPARIVLIGLVFLIWLSFFAYCELRFRRFCPVAVLTPPSPSDTAVAPSNKR